MSKSKHICFVAPRFPEGPTAGGAETLLRNLAERAVLKGQKVTFLTTCAKNHFTWANELPAGRKDIDGLEVIFFPVDEDRNIKAFLQVQDTISRGSSVTRDEEDLWLRNNINSKALCEHLRKHGNKYDRIVTGPYLFGLIYFASLIHPEKTLLVPCLHDEPFAYLDCFNEMFRKVSAIIFNSEPERDLACRLFDLSDKKSAAELHVIGMGFTPFKADAESFSTDHNVTAPYVLYCGRREAMKGTPLLIDYLTAFRARTGKDIKLVLTGTGIVDIPDEFAPHVIDLGLVSETEKRRAMAGATVFCHPSVNESFGIVLMESWLAGTAALVHAKSEVLRYQCSKSNGGLWFRSYPEFEEELMLLLEKPELRRKLGDAGREYVLREYSWEKVEERFFKALE
ncbi:glycosyltransferase family 4 protein [Verrucomicrobiota bacterium]